MRNSCVYNTIDLLVLHMVLLPGSESAGCFEILLSDKGRQLCIRIKASTRSHLPSLAGAHWAPLCSAARGFVLGCETADGVVWSKCAGTNLLEYCNFALRTQLT